VDQLPARPGRAFRHLLLIWFPLILRLPTRFPATTALPLDPYLWHWLAVTGALFLLSAAALAVRLRAVQAGDKQHEEGGHQEQESQAEEEEERKVADAPQVSPLPDTADTPAGAAPGTPSPDLAVSEEAIRPAGIARLGTVLPDTPLLDGHGRATTLYTAVGDGPSVLVFYRGARPPYHNAVLSAREERLLTRLTERGIPLIAISPWRPDGALDTRRDNGLASSVLSDPGNSIAGHLGILTLSPPGPAAQSGAGLDLAAVDADRTVAVPMPATVILDPGHAARWIHVHPDDTTRADPHQVIDALDQLGY
jgi:peroxiredoxin